MMINRYKNLVIFFLFGLLLSWTVSCSILPQTGRLAAPEEIEFWTMQLQPQFTDYFNQLIARFEAENPGVKVRWVDVPWSAMESKILTAVAAKTAPDVVNLNPDFASALASRNAWLYLDDRITPEVRNLYFPNIWNANTLNGKSFAIPWYLSASICIYNNQLLAQAGISQPPTSYSELAQVAKQVKEKTGKYAFFTTLVPEDSSEVLESLVKMGVQLVDNRQKAAFNTPEGRAAFQFWVDLYQDRLLPREVLTQGHRRAIELYQAGEIAMLFAGPEFLDRIAQNAPGIFQVSATSPQVIGNTGKRHIAVMNLAIPRDSDRPDDALKFALFVTNPENQLKFAQIANILPSTIESVNEYKHQLDADREKTTLEKGLAVSATQMDSAEVLIPAMENLNILQKMIYDNLQAAMLGEKTVDKAVADAAREWDNQGSIQNSKFKIQKMVN